MTGYELTLAVTALADLLASKLADDELKLVAAIFTQLGDTLATISTQREICNSNKDDKKDDKKDDTKDDTKDKKNKYKNQPESF